MFNSLDTSRVGKRQVEEITYNFRQPVEPDDALKDLNREMDIGEDYLDTEEEVNFIESFEIKNSDNLKAIASFIITYLDKINDIQATYDTLTKEYVNIEVVQHEQKHIENTLKSFEWLAKEGHEVERQLAFIKLNKLKTIGYSNITEHLMAEYGDDIFNETDNYDVEVDMMDVEGGDQPGRVNELGLDQYEMEEMGQVIDLEEVEDADQDYGIIAID